MIAVSTDRSNTCLKALGGCFVIQRFSGSFIELSGDGAQLGLAMYQKIWAFWKVLPQQSVGIFVSAALPWDVWVTEKDIDIRRQREVPMSRHLLAAVASKGLVKFFRQILRLLDEGRNDAVAVLVANFYQHHKAGITLDQHGNEAVARACNQVILLQADRRMHAFAVRPMTWDRTILDCSRSFPN